MMHKYRGEAALLLTVIIWGYGFVAVGQSLVYLTPFQMLFARFVIGVLATLVFFRKRIGLIDQDTLIKGAKLGTIQFIGFSSSDHRFYLYHTGEQCVFNLGICHPCTIDRFAAV